MSLGASCTHCLCPTEPGPAAACPAHGEVPLLWRPDTIDYQGFAEVAAAVEAVPLLLPWPLSPGWTITDLGVVCEHVDAPDAWRPLGGLTAVGGASDLDGRVEVTVLLEPAGSPLGVRVTGAVGDPLARVHSGTSTVRVQVAGRQVRLWPVDRLEEGIEPLDSEAFVGEYDGRLLWILVRPGSAALLFRDDWLLADISGFGPEALEIPFGGPRPRW